MGTGFCVGTTFKNKPGFPWHSSTSTIFNTPPSGSQVEQSAGHANCIDQLTKSPVSLPQISLITKVQVPLTGLPGTLKSSKSQFGASIAPANGSVTPPQGMVQRPVKQGLPPLQVYGPLFVIGF